MELALLMLVIPFYILADVLRGIDPRQWLPKDQ
jgi:hypothetical protein